MPCHWGLGSNHGLSRSRPRARLPMVWLLPQHLWPQELTRPGALPWGTLLMPFTAVGQHACLTPAHPSSVSPCLRLVTRGLVSY